MVVVAVVVTSGSAVASVAPAIQGNKCAKVGSTRTYKKVSYICTASGKKKVWQTASSSPGTAGTTTTVASTTTTVASTTTDCNLRTTGSGKAAGANESMPGGNRVRAAISSDGITWSRIPDAILDQIGTPSLVIGPKGLPLLYTTAHQVNGRQDGFVVSIGTADGRSWRHCQVSLKGFPAGLLGVDPDVVSLSGGSYRMYLTGSASPGSSRIAIHYADSADGLTWTYGGLAFEHSESILDSVTFQVGASWHMYALIGSSTDMIHGISSDGRTFTFVGKGPVLLNGQKVVLSQAIVMSGQIRVFAFAPPGSWVRSLITTDGTNWTPDAQAALVFDSSVEYKFIRDPAVMQLTNSSYLMAYATAIP